MSADLQSVARVVLALKKKPGERSYYEIDRALAESAPLLAAELLRVGEENAKQAERIAALETETCCDVCAGRKTLLTGDVCPTCKGTRHIGRTVTTLRERLYDVESRLAALQDALRKVVSVEQPIHVFVNTSGVIAHECFWCKVLWVGTADKHPTNGCAYTLLTEARAPRTGETFDLIAHLYRQRAFSEKTFGPGRRTEGVCDHIAKELREIAAKPDDVSEWIDVVLLAFDGAWRHGFTPEQIVEALNTKQSKNESRTWPDWRTAPAGKAIEHDRSAEVPAHPVGVAQPVDASEWQNAQLQKERAELCRCGHPAGDHMSDGCHFINSPTGENVAALNYCECHEFDPRTISEAQATEYEFNVPASFPDPLVVEATACSCHSGSICGAACQRGAHHAGCHDATPPMERPAETAIRCKCRELNCVVHAVNVDRTKER